jgi:hypothetical protein
MRRSGTTILFDCFSQDERFDPFYEPLTVDKPTFGGGSGARAEDLFASVREVRRAYLARRGTPGLTPLLNHGSPRRADLELESELPPFVEDYLAFLLASGQRPLVKFTRAAAKVAVLSRLDPHALFIHLVRDPRAVATSHVLGRRPALPDPRNPAERMRFFQLRTRRGRWGSLDLSRRILEDPGAPELRWPPDFVRVLLVWKTLFETTHAVGSARLGDRYVLVRHEDFALAPVETLGKLYARMGLDLPGSVAGWARRHVRPPRPAFAPGHRAWRRAIHRLGLEPAMVEAGYAADAPAPGPRGVRTP